LGAAAPDVRFSSALLKLTSAVVQVSDDPATRITAGTLTGRLPGERELAKECYRVSYDTMRHAMSVLRELGLIRTVHGRGTLAVNPGKP
jgi:DNA-binding GntR family transcriptional regulator